MKNVALTINSKEASKKNNNLNSVSKIRLHFIKKLIKKIKLLKKQKKK